MERLKSTAFYVAAMLTAYFVSSCAAFAIATDDIVGALKNAVFLFFIMNFGLQLALALAFGLVLLGPGRWRCVYIIHPLVVPIVMLIQNFQYDHLHTWIEILRHTSWAGIVSVSLWATDRFMIERFLSRNPNAKLES